VISNIIRARAPMKRLTRCSIEWRKQEMPNSALVSDVCAAALRAFYNAPQRER
jgi:hypothetical protein